MKQIEDTGGEAYAFPVIEMKMPSEEILFHTDTALSRLTEYDWIFFTSVNGVDYFFQHLGRLGQDISGLHKANIAAVGPATKEALRFHGIDALELPKQFQAEGLMEAYGEYLKPGQHVLLPRGDLARDWLPRTLIDKGLSVTEAVMYVNVPAGIHDQNLLDLILQGEIDVVTFTSSSTVDGLLRALRRMGSDDPVEALRSVKVACIGQPTAQTAEKAGLHITILAKQATTSSLVEGICDWYINLDEYMNQT